MFTHLDQNAAATLGPIAVSFAWLGSGGGAAGMGPGAVLPSVLDPGAPVRDDAKIARLEAWARQASHSARAFERAAQHLVSGAATVERSDYSGWEGHAAEAYRQYAGLVARRGRHRSEEIFAVEHALTDLARRCTDMAERERMKPEFSAGVTSAAS